MATAQNIPSSLQPGRERLQFSEPPSPLSRAPTLTLQLPPTATPEAAARIKLRVKSIILEGASAYTFDALSPLYADLIGKEVTAADIYALAARIGFKYGQDGYLVARAVIVPQAIDPKGAVIRIRVIEGFIERVEWPAAAAHYRDLFTPCLEAIKAERPARTRTIERCLLLASDLPGLTFSSTLVAGKDPNGGSVLVVSLAEKPFDAVARIDNRGVPGRGPWEATGTVTENNQLRLHEALSFTYATAFDPKELQFFSGTWHQVLTPDGLSFDFTGSHSIGKPGLPSLTSINFGNDTTSFESGFTYPVIRSREQNLRLSALGFVEDVHSDALGSPFIEDRLRGLRIRANYDQVDTWLPTLGQSQLIATFSQGIDGLGSTRDGNPLASVANGKVDFTKVELLANRTQVLIDGFSVFGALYGQWAGSPLLSAEQCGYGGIDFGRAFDFYELAGDRCLSELGELRYDLAVPGNPFSLTQLYGFADHGDVYRVNPSASTLRHLSGASTGVGLRLAALDHFTADFQGAKAIDGRANDGWRFFMVVSAHY